MRIKEKVQAWFRTRDGVAAAHMAYAWHYAGIGGGRWPESLGQPWSFAAAAASATADMLDTTDLIWCDPPMVDLIAAAADTYPPEPFSEHNIPSPAGILIFSKPLPAVWRRHGDQETHELAAIIWATGHDQEDRPVLSITAWRRFIGHSRHTSAKTDIHWPGLRLQSQAIGLYGAPPEDDGGPAGPNRILQTFTALCRTPLVREETRRSTKRSQSIDDGEIHDQRLRRIYLRRPEHAAEELEEAVAARSGKPTRGHWVRGHWKAQWYPSIEEHRTIWIAGYARGDFDLGEVTGHKVLVASGRADVPVATSTSTTAHESAARTNPQWTSPDADA